MKFLSLGESILRRHASTIIQTAIALAVVIGLLVMVAVFNVSSTFISANPIKRQTLFKVQSVDTMKYSRDRAREKAYDKTFDVEIAKEMALIKASGATHVAIGTPYDAEFVPFLTRWVTAARTVGLSVWFRGNFSGWEGWFDYADITPARHTELTKAFILSHPDLFQNGDVFTSCPECENGGPGDPRMTGNVDEYRAFLIKEADTVKAAFKQIGKDIASPYYSMNGDVGKLIMDESTAQKLGGIAIIDHYTASPDIFEQDILDLAEQTGLEVGFGEFGAPIPDINGDMDQREQAQFVDMLLDKAYVNSDVVTLMNYWTMRGGTTEIMDHNGQPREAYLTLQKYYTAPFIAGRITNSIGEMLPDISMIIKGSGYMTKTGIYGEYQLFIVDNAVEIVVGGNGYETKTLSMARPSSHQTEFNITLEPDHYSWRYMIKSAIYSLQQSLGLR